MRFCPLRSFAYVLLSFIFLRFFLYSLVPLVFFRLVVTSCLFLFAFTAHASFHFLAFLVGRIFCNTYYARPLPFFGLFFLVFS